MKRTIALLLIIVLLSVVGCKLSVKTPETSVEVGEDKVSVETTETSTEISTESSKVDNLEEDLEDVEVDTSILDDW